MGSKHWLPMESLDVRSSSRVWPFGGSYVGSKPWLPMGSAYLRSISGKEWPYSCCRVGAESVAMVVNV